jgi:hypothetical protein
MEKGLKVSIHNNSKTTSIKIALYPLFTQIQRNNEKWLCKCIVHKGKEFSWVQGLGHMGKRNYIRLINQLIPKKKIEEFSTTQRNPNWVYYWLSNELLLHKIYPNFENKDAMMA